MAPNANTHLLTARDYFRLTPWEYSGGGVLQLDLGDGATHTPRPGSRAQRAATSHSGRQHREQAQAMSCLRSRADDDELRAAIELSVIRAYSSFGSRAANAANATSSNAAQQPSNNVASNNVLSNALVWRAATLPQSRAAPLDLQMPPTHIPSGADVRVGRRGYSPPAHSSEVPLGHAGQATTRSRSSAPSAAGAGGSTAAAAAVAAVAAVAGSSSSRHAELRTPPPPPPPPHIAPHRGSRSPSASPSASPRRPHDYLYRHPHHDYRLDAAYGGGGGTSSRGHSPNTYA